MSGWSRRHVSDLCRPLQSRAPALQKSDGTVFGPAAARRQRRHPLAFPTIRQEQLAPKSRASALSPCPDLRCDRCASIGQRAGACSCVEHAPHKCSLITCTSARMHARQTLPAGIGCGVRKQQRQQQRHIGKQFRCRARRSASSAKKCTKKMSNVLAHAHSHPRGAAKRLSVTTISGAHTHLLYAGDNMANAHNVFEPDCDYCRLRHRDCCGNNQVHCASIHGMCSCAGRGVSKHAYSQTHVRTCRQRCA